jgi:hypothetical protein
MNYVVDAKTLKRFWSKVEKTDGCWLWKAGDVFCLETQKPMKQITPKRFSYQLRHDVELDRYDAVNQTCGNTLCVNPDHLTLPSKRTAEDEFWDAITVPEDPNECWVWQRISKRGSPVIKFHWHDDNGQHAKEYSARYIALKLFGISPDDSNHAISTCDTQLCVNPTHFVYGDKARFWNKVSKLSEANGGCWAWLGGNDKNGYGKFAFYMDGKKKHTRAHRYSYYLATGIWLKALHVCHSCDHPYCVNPAHLFPGTNQENMADRNSKGRQARGSRSGCAKLTEEKVKEIRDLFATGNYTKKQIADLYHISASNTSSIILGQTWKHVV